MISALAFGFADIYFPLKNYSFERLHIFLFNLCTGGTIILYYTEENKKMSITVRVFFTSSLIYTLSAFFELYPVTIIASFFLFGIAEKVRIKKFSFFPWNFFKKQTPVSEKFHQASLLCLSIAVIMGSAVILNNEYLNLVNIEKLKLNTFFLGFSFPLSLISLSVIFLMLNNIDQALTGIIKEICFWTLNLGVIIFFGFILFEKLIPQIFITIALFMAVLTVFFLHKKHAENIQQKQFLSSGIGFLAAASITGMIYIFMEMSRGYDPVKVKWILHLHVFASLYGWNLCGLAVICRFNDFPIKINSRSLIFVHWMTAVALAPLGVFYGTFAVLAVAGYVFIIFAIFFSKSYSDFATTDLIN